VIDLKDCPPSQRTTQIQQLLQDEAQRPFNLTSDLMLRGKLAGAVASRAHPAVGHASHRRRSLVDEHFI
jgi:hypothetical protein